MNASSIVASSRRFMLQLLLLLLPAWIVAFQPASSHKANHHDDAVSFHLGGVVHSTTTTRRRAGAIIKSSSRNYRNLATRSVLWSVPSDAAASKDDNTEQQQQQETTIAVCTGADCRVDGASDCLRQFQQHPVIKAVRRNSNNSTIAVRARPCVGPCGDGPNVVVYHPQTRKRISGQQLRPVRPPKSFIPEPALPGIYQVRTRGDVEFIVGLALDAAGAGAAESASASTVAGNTTPSADDDGKNVDEDEMIVIQSKRAWYDLDRRVLSFAQRIMWVSIALGWSEYTKKVGEPDIPQFAVAGILLGLSLFVSKSKK